MHKQKNKEESRQLIDIFTGFFTLMTWIALDREALKKFQGDEKFAVEQLQDLVKLKFPEGKYRDYYHLKTDCTRYKWPKLWFIGNKAMKIPVRDEAGAELVYEKVQTIVFNEKLNFSFSNKSCIEWPNDMFYKFTPGRNIDVSNEQNPPMLVDYYPQNNIPEHKPKVQETFEEIEKYFNKRNELDKFKFRSGLNILEQVVSSKNLESLIQRIEIPGRLGEDYFVYIIFPYINIDRDLIFNYNPGTDYEIILSTA